MAALRSDVKTLGERVENVNATLQRHGEQLVSLDKELRMMRGEIDATTQFRGTLVTLRDKLELTKPEELRAKILSPQLQGDLKDSINNETTFNNAIKLLKEHLERVVK